MTGKVEHPARPTLGARRWSGGSGSPPVAHRNLSNRMVRFPAPAENLSNRAPKPLQVDVAVAGGVR